MQNRSRLRNLLGNSHVSAMYSTKHVKVLLVANILLLSLFSLEIAGSIVSHSLALLADAVHVFSDFLGTLSAFVAIKISQKANTVKHTYGYSKISAIVAFANSIFILISIGFIVYQAIDRAFNQKEIIPIPLIVVSIFGLLANIIIALYVFKNGNTSSNAHQKNSTPKRGLLMQSVLIHFAYDIFGSIAGIITGVVIYFTNFFLIDIILSFFIGIILFRSTYVLLKSSVAVLLDTAPSHINAINLRKSIEASNSNIINAHHIHVWMMNESETATTIHITCKNNDNINDTIANVKLLLQQKYNILHSVIQIEINNEICLDEKISDSI